VQLKGKGEGLAITPLPAGHMIGGAMWRIVKDGEEDVVYAVDFNHKRERHLNGCDLDKISRPSLLITDAYNAKLKQMRRPVRDEALMTNILKTLRSGGNVLIAVDTAGRVLELSHMLDQLWQNRDSGLLAYSLALLNNVSFNVIEFAKSQIEWMSERLMRSFEGHRNNPFNFRHLKLCHSMQEANRVPSPKVVLASMPDLESGFSRELFAQWASHPKNSIILTSRSSRGTLAHDLITRGGNDRLINMEIKKRVKLAGAELEEYNNRSKKSDGSDPASAAAEAMDEDEESSSDEEMETSGAKKAGGLGGLGGLGGAKAGGHAAKAVKHDIIMKGGAAAAAAAAQNVVGLEEGATGSGAVKGVQKQGFFKSTKSKFLMFPFHEEKLRWDDYGEIIKPEEWIDTSMDTSASGATDKAEDKEGAANGSSDAASAQPEVPTKCVSTMTKLQIKAQVQFIDFEGRADGESIYRCIAKMKPRRVIIVRGTKDDSKALADACVNVVGGGEDDASDANSLLDDADNKKRRVFTPKNGEVVDATTETHIYQVRLTDSLMSKLKFRRGGKDNSLLAWVDAHIAYDAEDKSDVVAKSEGASEEASTEASNAAPTLEPTPEDQITGHQSNFVNELKLSDFKMVLSKHNINSEFQGGVLFCGTNSQVALRRHDSGRVTIEGCVCEDYYIVRNLLYEQYAIV